MQQRLPSVVSCLALAFLTACGGGAADAAGVYHLDPAAFREMMAAQMKGGPGEPMKEQLDQMVAGMKGTIELKADGTATMTMQMPPFVNESTSGTWKVAGDAISITAKNKAGKEETKTAKLAGGAITIEEEEDGKKMTMVFRRQ